MKTVVVSNSIIGAVEEVQLRSKAGKVIQQDPSSSLTEWSLTECNSSCMYECMSTKKTLLMAVVVIIIAVYNESKDKIIHFINSYIHVLKKISNEKKI